MAQRGRRADLQSASPAHSHFRYRGLWQLPEEARSPPKAATGPSRSLEGHLTLLPVGQERRQTPTASPICGFPSVHRDRNFSGVPSPGSPPGPESGLSQGPPLHTAWRCQPGVRGMSAAAGLGAVPQESPPQDEPRRPPWASLSSCGGGATHFPCHRAKRWDQLFRTQMHSFIKGRTPPWCDIPDAPPPSLTLGVGAAGLFCRLRSRRTDRRPWRKRLGHNFFDVRQAILGLGHPVI